MLADDGRGGIRSGSLAPGLHPPATWLTAMIDFIADQLPRWRDRPGRPNVEAETRLTSQLCAHLNSAARKSSGWDVLQFRVEEPDTARPARRVDMAAAPCAETIWIGGRSHGDFDTLLPIECKRLPTPDERDREKREYLLTFKGSTGGVQRFKAGHHGSQHNLAVMIGYVQAGDIPSWVRRIDSWVRALARARVTGWTAGDNLRISSHDRGLRLAMLASVHDRPGSLPAIDLRHLWIEMP